QLGFVDAVSTDNYEHPADFATKHGSVSYGKQRWTVDDDHIVAITQLTKKRAHGPGPQKFARIRRNLTRRENVEVGVTPRLNDLIEVSFADEHGGKANPPLQACVIRKR